MKSEPIFEMRIDTMTKRLTITLIALITAVLASSAVMFAHPGHEHKVMGTVTMAAADHIMLKDKDAKDVTIKVTKETKVQSKPAMKVEEIKAGTRVVVTAVVADVRAQLGVIRRRAAARIRHVDEAIVVVVDAVVACVELERRAVRRAAVARGGVAVITDLARLVVDHAVAAALRLAARTARRVRRVRVRIAIVARLAECRVRDPVAAALRQAIGTTRRVWSVGIRRAFVTLLADVDDAVAAEACKGADAGRAADPTAGTVAVDLAIFADIDDAVAAAGLNDRTAEKRR